MLLTLAELIERTARRLEFRIDGAAARCLAGVSRGTPREAIRLLRKSHQQARADGKGLIDAAIAIRTLQHLGIDERGLDPLDRAYLTVLEDHGPIGLARAASMLGVDPRVLDRDHEPYLSRLDLMGTTPHGRIAKAREAPMTAPTEDRRAPYRRAVALAG